MANFKFRNSWSDAARTDPRFREPLPDVGQVVLEQPVESQIAAAELPRVEASAPPATSPWVGPTSIMAGRRCKLTPARLAEAEQFRAEGMSWPAIARKFGCHRMALYHAIRRPCPADHKQRPTERP